MSQHAILHHIVVRFCELNSRTPRAAPAAWGRLGFTPPHNLQPRRNWPLLSQTCPPVPFGALEGASPKEPRSLPAARRSAALWRFRTAPRGPRRGAPFPPLPLLSLPSPPCKLAAADPAAAKAGGSGRRGWNPARGNCAGSEGSSRSPELGTEESCRDICARPS